MNIQLNLHFIQITPEQPPALIGTVIKSSSPDFKRSFRPASPSTKELAEEILRHHQNGFPQYFLPDLLSEEKASASLRSNDSQENSLFDLGAPFNPFSLN
jgi:hypothetical protein